jgi:hypothetical protein
VSEHAAVNADSILQVSYSMAGNSPKSDDHIELSLLRGRVDCAEISDEGHLDVSNFKTGGWTDFESFGASPIKLDAGNRQEFTLCFAQAAEVLLQSMCIDKKCT